MPKSQFLQSSFASGELSPLIKGRTDLDQYYKGGQIAENVVIVPQGGIKRRPGTVSISEPIQDLSRRTNIPTMPNGGTAANINDGNPLTYGITNVNLSPENVIAEYDFGSPIAFDFIDLRAISIALGPTYTFELTNTVRLEVSSNGTSWQQFGPANKLRISSAFESSGRFTYESGGQNWQYVRLIIENFVVLGATVKVGEFNLKYQNGSVSDVKTFDFSYGFDEHYLGVLTSGNMRFYRAPHSGSADTVYVGDVLVPYSLTNVASVRDAQTENVMLLFNKDNAPDRIIFNGVIPDGIQNKFPAFTSGPIPFSNVPQFDYNDADSPPSQPAVQVLTFANGFVPGDRFQLDIQGILSKNISYAGDDSANGVESESTAFNLQKNIQEMPLFGDSGVEVQRTGVNQYTITIGDESAQPLKLFSGFQTSGSTGNHSLSFTRTDVGISRKEDVWSDDRGYPLMAAFNEGRLWIGGTRSKRQSLFASKAGDLFNFFSEEGADDDGIFATINSRNLTEIVDVNPDRGLQVFCAGAEFIVKGNTPSTIQIEAETQLGSFNLESKALDGATLFINGNGNTLRQYLYNFNEDAYTSNDISVLSSHLINKPLDMAALDGTSSEDAAWVFIINQDGTAAVLNTVRAQDINGFTKWQPHYVSEDENTKLESCSVVGKELYVVATYKKKLPSNVIQIKKCIEKWDFNALLDGQKEFDPPNVGVSDQMDLGLKFAYTEVGVIADKTVLPDRVADANGIIYFTEEEQSIVVGVGKSYKAGHNFTSSFKSMPINTNAGTRTGQNVMKEKKITRINLRVLDTAGVYVDGNPVAVREFGDANNSPLNTPVTPKTGIIEDNNGGNGWGTEVVPLITAPSATPFHLQSIEYEVESS